MGLKMRTALYASVLGAGMLASPVLVYADTVTIDNSVSVTAKTGGNNASGGSSSGMDGEDGNVVEGTAHVSVSAQTIVNDEVVDDISKDEDGVSEVHLTQEVKYQNGETSTHAELTTSPKEGDESETGGSVDVSVLSEDMQGRDEEQQKPSLFSAIKNFFKHVFSIFYT